MSSLTAQAPDVDSDRAFWNLHQHSSASAFGERWSATRQAMTKIPEHLAANDLAGAHLIKGQSKLPIEIIDGQYRHIQFLIEV
jgi:hypothetical protein